MGRWRGVDRKGRGGMEEMRGRMKYESEKKVRKLLLNVIRDWSDQNQLSTSLSLRCELSDMIFDIVIQGGTLARALEEQTDGE